MDAMESKSWANAEPPIQFISRHQPGGLAALAVDESECVVVMDTALVSISSRGQMGNTCDGSSRRIASCLLIAGTRSYGNLLRACFEWRTGAILHVDMSDCMEGKPLSDTFLQDCLFNPPPSINALEKPLPNALSCISEEEESTRSTKVELNDSRDISDLKYSRDNSNLEDSRDISDLKDSRDNFAKVKDSRDISDLKDSSDNFAKVKDSRDNSNLKYSRDNFAKAELRDYRDFSNLKDCMVSSKEEPESILEAYIRKRNKRLERKLKNPESEGCTTVWIS
ncbi:hypothetical protein TNCT_338831 [Trichonephila clavata]|uniref:Uncharacterized protein n=1 Tax=Trichonephila clavata TaxID=2740835 RepID=A0A8X6HXN9_TRICU|nr:hypothetical protein TNCT_338831 [Trichonephila clavata]